MGKGDYRDLCRPLINKLPPFKGLDIRFLIISPIKGRGFANQGSTLAASISPGGQVLQMLNGSEDKILGYVLPKGSMYPIIRYLSFG